MSLQIQQTVQLGPFALPRQEFPLKFSEILRKKAINIVRLVDLEPDSENSFLVVVQQVTRPKNLVQFSVTDFSADIIMSVSAPDKRIDQIKENDVLCLNRVMVRKFGARKIILVNTPQKIIGIGPALNLRCCVQCKRKIPSSDRFCVLHMKEYIRKNHLALCGINLPITQIAQQENRPSLSGDVDLATIDPVADFQPLSTSDKTKLFMDAMQKQKEAIDSKISEVRMNAPKPSKPVPQTFRSLPQNTTQVFYCMECKKVTMTFNDNCKHAGHTQVMRIARLKHYQC